MNFRPHSLNDPYVTTQEYSRTQNIIHSLIELLGKITLI
jgi:hypothetical protein